MCFWAVGQRRAALLGPCQVCAIQAFLQTRLGALPAPSAHSALFLSLGHTAVQIHRHPYNDRHVVLGPVTLEGQCWYPPPQPRSTDPHIDTWQKMGEPRHFAQSGANSLVLKSPRSNQCLVMISQVPTTLQSSLCQAQRLQDLSTSQPDPRELGLGPTGKAQGASTFVHMHTHCGDSLRPSRTSPCLLQPMASCSMALSHCFT